MTDLRPPDGYVNHWDDYGGVGARFSCHEAEEHCRHCGRRLVEHIVTSDSRSRRTGQPTYARYHSCPTWVEGWRVRWWAKGWACPGMHHDSHDADNPLSARGYR